MTMLQIYLMVTILPNIDHLIGICLFVATVAILALTIYGVVMLTSGHNSKENEAMANGAIAYAKRLCFITLALAFITVPIPSEKQLAVIIAGSYVTQMQGLKDMPPKVVDFINTYLDTVTKEMKQEALKAIKE